MKKIDSKNDNSVDLPLRSSCSHCRGIYEVDSHDDLFRGYSILKDSLWCICPHCGRVACAVPFAGIIVTRNYPRIPILKWLFR